MATRLFALLIGIDNYKSGHIWNLDYSRDDAKRIKSWLVDDLCVPRDQIRMLLDGEATKYSIENTFTTHLVDNPNIQRGDAMLVYFAGHGSTVAAPRDWFSGVSRPSNVEVLCPYDHDTKTPDGRVAGISDRSMRTLISDLCKAKGDNITLILDCCFSPQWSRANVRERQSTRWTPTIKATPEDLVKGLWKGPSGSPPEDKGRGFYWKYVTTHTVLGACPHGQHAKEGKDGGRFTTALLEAREHLTLHRTTYTALMSHLTVEEGRNPVCVGIHKDRIVFGAIPFMADSRYVSINTSQDSQFRVDVGAIHGVVEGTEFSIHSHNRRGSLNPSIASIRVSEVHPTWSLAQASDDSTMQDMTIGRWAQITRWNNGGMPLKVYAKKLCAKIVGGWKKLGQSIRKIGCHGTKAEVTAVQSDRQSAAMHDNVMSEKHGRITAQATL
jgi:hypothetical protein